MSYLPTQNPVFSGTEDYLQRTWNWVRLLGTAYLAFCVVASISMLFSFWTPGGEVVTPAVLGLAQPDAEQLLRRAGLIPVPVDGNRTDRYQAGEVMQQSIAAGTHVGRGRRVFLAICEGPEHAVVPAVLNLDSDQAGKLITSVGLQGSIAMSVHSNTVAFQGIVQQFPPAGARVPAGSVVSLVVSDGPPDETADGEITVDPEWAKALASRVSRADDASTGAPPDPDIEPDAPGDISATGSEQFAQSQTAKDSGGIAPPGSRDTIAGSDVAGTSAGILNGPETDPVADQPSTPAADTTDLETGARIRLRNQARSALPDSPSRPGRSHQHGAVIHHSTGESAREVDSASADNPTSNADLQTAPILDLDAH